ncbi:MFS transporter [Kitasatospora saccharophila]|uniref:MFS transporter n=1 Tax=Kitasatospora saccharophila TaxID=407973 RepID=UPI003633D8BB
MSNSQPPPAGAGPAGLSRGLVLLLATACGVIVANNYYAQPLLPALQHAFGTGPATAGLCVTLNQLGYAAGLLFIVPLGDLAGRRRLVTLLLSVDAVVLAGAALAPGIWPLIGLLAAAGTAGTAINVLVPTAATLAGDHQRGRVVGTVMTGLLLGILLARTVAGLIDSAVGWRPVYGIAAVAAAVLAVTLHAKLPDLPAAPGAGYLRLLGSVAALVRDEPFLRRRMAAGALGFGAFQLLWTALPFMLSDRPYSYGSSVIGLFGLLGAAGPPPPSPPAGSRTAASPTAPPARCSPCWPGPGRCSRPAGTRCRWSWASCCSTSGSRASTCSTRDASTCSRRSCGPAPPPPTCPPTSSAARPAAPSPSPCTRCGAGAGCAPPAR